MRANKINSVSIALEFSPAVPGRLYNKIALAGRIRVKTRRYKMVRWMMISTNMTRFLNLVGSSYPIRVSDESWFINLYLQFIFYFFKIMFLQEGGVCTKPFGLSELWFTSVEGVSKEQTPTKLFLWRSQLKRRAWQLLIARRVIENKLLRILSHYISYLLVTYYLIVSL